MTTAEIAAQLIALCRRGDYLGAQRHLYADDAVSIEPEGRPGGITRGLAALQEKTRGFENTFETRGAVISEPIVAEPFFAASMTVDVTERKSGKRMTLSEICVYEVKGGKIVREQFFYAVPPAGTTP